MPANILQPSGEETLMRRRVKRGTSCSAKNRSTEFNCKLETLESRTMMSHSPGSAPPPAPSISVSIRYGSELVVTGSSANDTIKITESGSTLTIAADGQVYTDPAPSAGVFVYTRGGSDSVTIDASVSARTTVDSIDAGKTIINTAGINVSVWMDSTDTETGATTGLHAVASFAGGVSKAVGAALANPKDAKQTVAV